MSVPDIAAIERALDSEETTGWRTDRSQLVDDLRALIARVRELEGALHCALCGASLRRGCISCGHIWDEEEQT